MQVKNSTVNGILGNVFANLVGLHTFPLNLNSLYLIPFEGNSMLHLPEGAMGMPSV